MDQVFLNEIVFENFRNLKNTHFQFGPKINCIFGDNGNGKTNLLEGIYYFLNGKSFRKNANFRTIISIDTHKPELTICGKLTKNNSTISVAQRININDKEIWLNGEHNSKTKVSFPSVVVNPFDPGNFTSTPSYRREWFDDLFSSLDKEYKRNISKYKKILRIRNNLLAKKPPHYISQIKALNPQFIELSIYLSNYRRTLLDKINPKVLEVFGKVFNLSNKLTVQLESTVHQNFAEKVEKFHEKDQILGKTSIGPHRDDYVLLFDGNPAFDFCSIGQLKMAYLSILFAYIELFRYKFNAYPIVLIDDVSGELDHSRWSNLVNYINQCNYQVFISTANEKFREELAALTSAKYFTIQNGDLV